MQLQGRALGQESLQVAHTLNLLGECYREEALYPKARDAQNRAYVIRIRLVGGGNMDEDEMNDLDDEGSLGGESVRCTSWGWVRL